MLNLMTVYDKHWHKCKFIQILTSIYSTVGTLDIGTDWPEQTQ